MMTQPEKELVTTSEAATILGISRIAVFKRIKAGRLPALKVGRSYVIKRLDLVGSSRPLGAGDKRRIDTAIHRAVKEYRQAFELLGRA